MVSLEAKSSLLTASSECHRWTKLKTSNVHTILQKVHWKYKQKFVTGNTAYFIYLPVIYCKIDCTALCHCAIVCECTASSIYRFMWLYRCTCTLYVIVSVFVTAPLWRSAMWIYQFVSLYPYIVVSQNTTVQLYVVVPLCFCAVVHVCESAYLRSNSAKRLWRKWTHTHTHTVGRP